jgi:hypothetical protein
VQFAINTEKSEINVLGNNYNRLAFQVVDRTGRELALATFIAAILNVQRCDMPNNRPTFHEYTAQNR